MKKFSLIATILILLFSCSNKSVMIEKENISQNLDKVFPVYVQKMLLSGQAVLTNIEYKDDRIFLNGQVNAFSNMKKIDTSLVVSCIPVFDEKKKSFYLGDFKIETLDSGLHFRYDKLLKAEFLNSIYQNAENNPLYPIKIAENYKAIKELNFSGCKFGKNGYSAKFE